MSINIRGFHLNERAELAENDPERFDNLFGGAPSVGEVLLAREARPSRAEIITANIPVDHGRTRICRRGGGEN
ncbi:hypothetical protein [Sedimenticola hydrogenitrophicus]|uniref:hypothetical protein n=1 Tax=Sedimenticola hydrogenitrophicus TaxID=2967975 RepID=UPI0021A87954|nr:hypothetical protein [Sedimenticola hydrogenitrophicus]